MFDIICVETRLTVDAVMTGPEKSREGITAVVVFSHLDENDLFVLDRTFEDDLVVVIHREYYKTVINEMTLKRLEFGQSARSFGNACKAMQFLGFLFLNGSSPS